MQRQTLIAALVILFCCSGCYLDRESRSDEVAVKVLQEEQKKNQVAIAKMQEEIKALRKAQAPKIVLFPKGVEKKPQKSFAERHHEQRMAKLKADKLKVQKEAELAKEFAPELRELAFKKAQFLDANRKYARMFQNPRTWGSQAAKEFFSQRDAAFKEIVDAEADLKSRMSEARANLDLEVEKIRSGS